jgi:hypothetical protein
LEDGSSVPSRKNTKPDRGISQHSAGTISRKVRTDVVFRIAATKANKVGRIASDDTKTTRSQADEPANNECKAPIRT